jgi:hypothetical protein
MAQRNRDFSQLSISMLGSADDLKQNPSQLSQLSALGVQEMVLFMTGPDSRATTAKLEAFARARMP